MQKPPIPVTVIGGYLGSGKTCLLNHILGQADGADFAILVNDFGALNIDAALIEFNGGQAYRLENGCICCNIGNSLVTTLLAILRLQTKPKKILIESSGVADPARIADIARISPSLKLDQIITLVDGGRILDLLNDKLLGDTVLRQLVAANTILINKIDLIDQKEITEIKQLLQTQNCDAKLIKTQFSKAPLSVLFTAQSPQQIKQTVKQKKLAKKLKGNSSVGAIRNFQRGSVSADDHDALFWRWKFESDKPFIRERLENVLAELLPTLERAKGFVRFTDSPKQLFLLQLTRAGYSFTEISNASRNTSIENNSGSNVVMLGKQDKPDFTDLRLKLSATLETS